MPDPNTGPVTAPIPSQVAADGVQLRWLDGYGYRCPRCKLFVAHALSDYPRWCPRCPAPEMAPRTNVDLLAELVRNGPEVLDEPDAWAAYLDAAGVRATARSAAAVAEGAQ